MTAKGTTRKLNDGNEIPVLGLGTYALKYNLSESGDKALPTLPQVKHSERGGSKNKECQLSVEVAIECGYRHIDTAAFYDNEDEVGTGIRNKIQDGTVGRQDLFITTKLWNDRHEEDKVVPSLRESLAKFGLEFVDLYLIHWPVGVNEDGSFNEVDYLDTWRGMEKCKQLGLAKSIGVSNFSIPQLERLLKNCTVKPTVNQVEANPNLTQKKLLNFCKENDIVLTAYSPFGSMPEAKTTETSPAPRLNDPILKDIADKYNKTTTQVVLRYLLDCGMVTIPKSVTPARIAQNIDIFDFNLTPGEISKIDDFNKDYRVVAVPMWKSHKYFPF